jgi:hypothetical protein
MQEEVARQTSFRAIGLEGRLKGKVEIYRNIHMFKTLVIIWGLETVLVLGDMDNRKALIKINQMHSQTGSTIV